MFYCFEHSAGWITAAPSTGRKWTMGSWSGAGYPGLAGRWGKSARPLWALDSGRVGMVGGWVGVVGGVGRAMGSEAMIAAGAAHDHSFGGPRPV